MVVDLLVEAMTGERGIGYLGADKISGTDKIRTYCSKASLYSNESDLSKITQTQYHNEDRIEE